MGTFSARLARLYCAVGRKSSYIVPARPFRFNNSGFPMRKSWTFPMVRTSDVGYPLYRRQVTEARTIYTHVGGLACSTQVVAAASGPPPFFRSQTQSSTFPPFGKKSRKRGSRPNPAGRKIQKTPCTILPFRCILKARDRFGILRFPQRSRKTWPDRG